VDDSGTNLALTDTHLLFVRRLLGADDAAKCLHIDWVSKT